MINAINNFQNSNESVGSTKYNFTADKMPAVFALKKTANPEEKAPIKFDWINIDKKLSESFSNSQSALDKIVDSAKVKSISPSITEEERRKRIEEEKNHLSKTITERTAYNTKQLKKQKFRNVKYINT